MTVDVHVPVSDFSNRLLLGHLQHSTPVALMFYVGKVAMHCRSAFHF